MSPHDSTVAIILEGEERSFTTFGEDASGELYVAAGDGDIFRIEQTSTSLEGHPAGNELLIYPVPSKNRIFFKNSSDLTNKTLEISVYNYLGINVLRKGIKLTEGLSVSSLSPGIYWANINKNGSIYIGKFLVE